MAQASAFKPPKTEQPERYKEALEYLKRQLERKIGYGTAHDDVLVRKILSQ